MKKVNKVFKKIFIVGAWIKVLASEEGKNILTVSKEIDVTYSHVLFICKELKAMELITFKKQGRQCIIHYTENGKTAHNNILKLLSLVKSRL